MPSKGFLVILRYMKPDFKSMLDNLVEEEVKAVKQSTFHKHSRTMFVDGLNLFFRNFATLNYINQDGVHIGGLAGFLRSLGTLIKVIQPTSVYLIFDGMGSSTNRKNLIPEYKSGRGVTRMTNWDIFDSIEDEDEAKYGQIARLVHYLKCLPVTVISIDKAEADDVIAYLAKKVTQSTPQSKAFIVSSDKDYLQLVNDEITVYRPTEKDFYTYATVVDKMGVLPENFILLKTLTGDNSDSVKGIKGMGAKTAVKLFPQLKTEPITFNDLITIAEGKYKDNVLYSRLIFEEEQLRKTHKIMDLHNPILDEGQIELINELSSAPTPKLRPGEFLKMYHEDGLGHILKAPNYWIAETFSTVKGF